MRRPARIGRWEVESELGSGAIAEILLGVGRGVDGVRQEVALKRTIPERARVVEEAPLFAESLRAEARILACIRHPNVVGLVELIDETPPAIALERLSGCTLAALLERGPLQLDLALELAAQLAEALAAVHAAADEQGAPLEAVHRDVSPDNLFITTDGRLKLFDFNVSSYRGRPRSATGALQGRVAYMAPEQARGEAVEGRADVFSLGVVLWELAVGERLFWRGNTLSTLRALLDEPVARAIDHRPALPQVLDALLAQALDRQPRARPTAAVLAERLRGLLSPEPMERAPAGAEPSRQDRLASFAAQR